MFALLSVSNFSSSVCICTGIDGLYSKVCGIYGLSPSKYFAVCLREREGRGCTDQVHKRDVEEHAGGDGKDPRLHLLAGGDAQTDEEADESRERREEVPQQRPLD